MKYKHIIFNIDGTLIDTEYAVLHSFAAVVLYCFLISITIEPSSLVFSDNILYFVPLLSSCSLYLSYSCTIIFLHTLSFLRHDWKNTIPLIPIILLRTDASGSKIITCLNDEMIRLDIPLEKPCKA